MRDHLTIAEMTGYLEQALNPRALVDIDSHLEDCGQCRLRVNELERLESAVDEVMREYHAIEAADADHLTNDQLTTFVLGGLDPFNRKVVLKHLSSCSPCAEELEDLLALKKETELQVPAFGASRSTSFLNRFPAGLTRPARLMPINPWAIAITFVVVVGSLVYALTYLSGNRRGGERTASTPAGPAVSPAPVTTRPTPSSESSVKGLAPEDTNPAPPFHDIKRGRPAPVKENRSVAHSHAMSPGVSGHMLLLIDEGRRVTLDRQGNLRGLQTSDAGLRQEVRKALVTEKLPTHGAASELRGVPLRLLGGSATPDQFELIGPKGIVVRSDRPTFRWSALSGATGYKVDVVDSGLSVVASSEMLVSSQWTVTPPLTRGGVYRWQVTAYKNGQAVRAPKPPAPEAKFKILEAREAQEIDSLEASGVRSRLLLGVAYARAGLLEEAEREIRALVEDNSRSSVAKKLLSSIKANEE